MSMTYHAVIGTGTTPDGVIIEGLKDAVNEKDCVGLIWAGKPNATTEVVYDYILDNDIGFTMYYVEGTTPPRVFRESEHGVVQKVRNPEKAAIEAITGKGKVLFLWNEDMDDDQVDPVFDYKQPGVLVLELTNGLAPITNDVDIPTPTEPEVAKDEDEPEDDIRFTKDELEIMAAAAVKRYGAHIGAKSPTKSGIIAELFPEEEEPDAISLGAFDPDVDPTDDTPDQADDEEAAREVEGDLSHAAHELEAFKKAFIPALEDLSRALTRLAEYVYTH